MEVGGIPPPPRDQDPRVTNSRAQKRRHQKYLLVTIVGHADVEITGMDEIEGGARIALRSHLDW